MSVPTVDTCDREGRGIKLIKTNTYPIERWVGYYTDLACDVGVFDIYEGAERYDVLG